MDVGPTMQQIYPGGSEGQTRLAVAIESIKLLVQQKLMYNKSHELGLILVGTEGTNIYIYIYRDGQPPERSPRRRIRAHNKRKHPGQARPRISEIHGPNPEHQAIRGHSRRTSCRDGHDDRALRQEEDQQENFPANRRRLPRGR